MQEKITRFKGAVVHYRTTGHGQTLVLLHGFGEDGSIWNGIAERLSNQFQLIIPDLPGSGDSELIRSDKPDMDVYADCIRHILIEENSATCVMVGHSMGGYITLAFAEQYPDLLSAWGLFHSTAYADSEEKKATRMKGISFILEHGPGAFLSASIPGLFADPEKNKQLVKMLVEKGSRFNPEALIQYYHSMIGRPDRTEVLKKSSVPVLMIMGVADQAVPFHLALEQSYLPNRCFLHVLRNSGHMGMLEEPEKSVEILGNFLNNYVRINK